MIRGSNKLTFGGLFKRKNFNDFLVTEVAAAAVVADDDVAAVEDDDAGVGMEYHKDALELAEAERHPHHHSEK